MSTLITDLAVAKEQIARVGDYIDALQRENALLKLAQPARLSCMWREDECGAWNTSCGNIFEFNTGGPIDNKQKFCGYCGAELVQRHYEGEDD